jgi:hypothetical protein
MPLMDIIITATDISRRHVPAGTARKVRAAIQAGADPRAALIADRTLFSKLISASASEHAAVFDEDGSFLWAGAAAFTMPGEPQVRPASFLVSIWGGHECPEASAFSLTVAYAGDGLYAVRHNGGLALDAQGEPHLDRSGDPKLRFPLSEALLIAHRHAGNAQLGTVTAAQALARHAERGCPDELACGGRS